ncbi:MAG: heme biosynthesis protein HemY [Variibacter sp.]|nr:heme biosynthesis protein HemY [Variibacter sp.]
MIRILVFLGAVAAASLAAAWLADRPGEVVVTWLGWRIETSVMVVVAALAALVAFSIFVWTLLRFLLRSPRLAAHALRERRRRRGQRALSRGLIALASGDLPAAQRFAGEATRLAGAEPLTLLLKAQVAQVAGDRGAADAAFRAMTERQETKLLGLRGLFIEAERRGDREAARRYAEQAARSAPALPWAGQAVFEFRCAAGDWSGALEALEANLRAGLVDRATYRRHRAVLLTARALDLEHRDAAAAKALALEAAKLTPDLVPAATLAAHLCAESGEWRRAAKLLEAAWRRNAHPDIADLYAHLRPGDSAHDRLQRVRLLARLRPGDCESALAIARAAIDAQEFEEARAALAPLVAQPTQRVAMLMAELEERERGDSGRAREWMARAVRAQRDPAWTADGIVSDRWLPVSPVTGRIDAFAWKVPVAEIGPAGPALDARAAAAPAAALPASAGANAGAEAPGAEPPVKTKAEPRATGAEAPSPAAAPPAAASVTGAPAAAAPAASSPPPGRAVRPAAPSRAAVIPLMRAPDDPGPEPDLDEGAPPSANPLRGPYG